MGLAARFTLVVLSTAIYLALAVLGWGGAPFFDNPARIGLVIVTFLMAVVGMLAGGNLSPGVREDRGNRWVLPVFGVIGVLAGYLPAYTDRIDFWTLDGETIRWFGVAIFAVGGALRLLPVFILGRRFSGLVAIQPGHTLVTSGLYRFIRHPSYLGLLLTALGWSFGFRSGVGLLLLALLIPPLLARIHAEENLLQSQFGEEYRAYVKRTSRLIPGIY
ncbi:MAG TPA: isoprenylcysteine carboxylmethyltransferase family protein [Bryobacteraceae bacterium]|nr:isoprenylcysteine carboxylmethyltransferase family protein [Bryobacteraceae bacterium]